MLVVSPGLKSLTKGRVGALGSDDDYDLVITVGSFNESKKERYTISMDAFGSLRRCSCKYMNDSNSVCKHMFLAERQLGYTISYNYQSKTCNRNSISTAVNEGHSVEPTRRVGDSADGADFDHNDYEDIVEMVKENPG